MTWFVFGRGRTRHEGNEKKREIEEVGQSVGNIIYSKMDPSWHWGASPKSIRMLRLRILVKIDFLLWSL
jgi:hypothetical protein